MRRKSKSKSYSPEPYNKTNFDPALALAIGHMTFLWNYIENMLDAAFDQAIEAPPDLAHDIRSRINGLDGKIEIVKKAIGSPARFFVDE